MKRTKIHKILTTLVEFPTVTGDFTANNQALDFIDGFLTDRGMHIERFESNGFESIVATTRKTKTPKIMLSGHLDVVPAPESFYSVREVDDRLYGRGVLDMKFAIAAYLQLVDELQGNLADYDFGIMITTDEENGGKDGVAALLDKGYQPQVCILPDGGDDWQLQLTSKGFLYLRLSQFGKPAHGSRPWLGDNAILALMQTITEIQLLFPEAKPESNTFNIGTFSGGKAANQVADYAEASLDIRLCAESERQPIMKQIEAICARNKTEYYVDISGAATDFRLDNPFIAPFARLITKHTGIEVQGSHTLGSNDSRYLAEYNIPCISFYPTGGGHHGVDEWIAKRSLDDTLNILLDYIKEIGHTDQSVAKEELLLTTTH